MNECSMNYKTFELVYLLLSRYDCLGGDLLQFCIRLGGGLIGLRLGIGGRGLGINIGDAVISWPST